jgi:hypothetical protein
MIIELTIDRFEGEKAVLTAKDGSHIIWPKNKLPDDAKEGSTLEFSIRDDKTAEIEKKEIAKKILNEILDA